MSMESFLERMAESPSVTLEIPEYINENGESVAAHSLPVVVSDDSYRYRAIMGEHTLNLKFSLPGYMPIPIGTYCEFQGQTYTLETPENIKKNGERYYEYDLIFQSDQYKLSKFMLRNTIPGDTRLKFSYTARPQEFLRLLVDNMNARDEEGWIVGEPYVESAEKVVSFNHNTCAEALQMIAEAFETEWEVKGKTIYLQKVEYNKDNPLPLSYGKGNGFLPGLGRSEYSEVKPVERLFVQGGDRNIDASKYRRTEATGQIGSRELLMPASTRIRFDGTYFNDESGFNPQASDVREYFTDESGASVIRYENISRKGLIEGSLECTEIYPMREGTVSATEKVSDGWDFWDSSIPDRLDYSTPDLRIAGETATVIFQSGMLTGKEFEIMQTDKAITGYIHNDPENPGNPAKKRGRFKLVSQEIDGIMMPDGNYVPVVGDKYAVFHIGLPQTYVDDAERNMLKQAVKYLYDNEMPRFTFNGTLDAIWAQRDWTNIGGRLVLGGFIRFSDTQFLPEGMDIRITGIKDYVNKPYKPQIELSNNSKSGSWVHNMKRQIESDEVLTDTKDREVMQFTKRRFRDVAETMELLAESMLSFSEGINPITVQTMQAVVGDESLQFEYSAPSVNFMYVAGTGMVCPGGTLTHKTLGITDISTQNKEREYMSWIMPAAVLTPDDPAKGYYLYAKVEKAGATSPDRRFLISPTAMGMEDVGGYYHLLVGILNSEIEGTRSFAPLYGYTEILPGRITTDRIVSQNGFSYFDLALAQLLLANEGYTQGMDWNVTDSNVLTIKGKINALSAQLGGFMIDNEKFVSVNGREVDSVQTPNIVLDGSDGSGHMAAGEINWDNAGTFTAGIFHIPYRQDMVIVRGRQDSETSLGNIIITSKEVGSIPPSNDTITGDDEGEIISRINQPPIDYSNYTMASVPKIVSVAEGLVIPYNIVMDVSVTSNVMANAGSSQYTSNAASMFVGVLQILVSGKVVSSLSLEQFSLRVSSSSSSTQSNTKTVTGTLRASVAAGNGDVIVCRLLGNHISASATTTNPSTSNKASSEVLCTLSVNGASLSKETIIGSDGILVRLDKNNSFLMQRGSDDKLHIEWLGYPTNFASLPSGELWVDTDADGVIKVVP